MKNLFKLVIVITAVVMSSSAMNAQNAQKIAHIDLDSLISIMPESKVAQQAVQDYSKQLEQQVVAMQTELQTKYEDYQAHSKDWAEVVRASKEKELNDLNQRIQDFQTQAQSDYQKKSAELSKPVYDKAKVAIDDVAKANAYKYVLDTSSGLVIYHEPSDDIIGLVIKKLGITAPAPGTSVAPKTNPTAPKK